MADTEDIITTPTPAKTRPERDLVGKVETPNIVDQLRSELRKKVRRPDVYLEVPERPNMAIRFSPNLTQHQIRAWRRNSGEDTKAGLDSVKFSCYVLANTCTGIMLNNEMVTDDNANELIFSDDQIMAMVEADTVAECIKAIYVVEPHVEAVALAILEAAGFSDTVEQVDPTKTS